MLGTPVVPPGRLTRGIVRARAGLLGAHRRAAPPSIRVLEGLFGIFDNRVLRLLVDLDLPDRLDRPHDIVELAAATGRDRDALDRVLRYAVGRGFLGRDRGGHYRANAVTRVLRRDHPNSWRGWVEFAGSDWFWDSWLQADASLRGGGGNGTRVATGHEFFDYVTHVDADAGRAFNAAMEAGATLQAYTLSHGLDWRGTASVCDVGGGTGAALEVLLESQPHLRGTLFDLPAVVAAARPVLRSGTLSSRCHVEGGDFFSAVPAGADRYLLLAVVHDWDDDRASRILGCVRDAMRPDSRAFVIESELSGAPRDEFVQASDLLMCALASGRERTAGQFDALFAASGLTRLRTIPLATG
ncbi:MAG: methyltransferase, partial [Acidimicrobiia bacterium]